MRTINSFILLCVFCLFCQPTLAQHRVRLADLPPFERVVLIVKYFEGLHNKPKDFPYVGYGHQLQPGEHFTANMTERQADSLLRADLWKCFEHFKGYGKDALLTLLAYNVGVGRLLGYGKYSKSRLLRKIEAGDRNFYWEYVSFCRYKGKVLRGLVKRRQVEYMLFRLP